MRALLGMASSIPAAPGRRYGEGPLLFCERGREVLARADPELAVGGREVLLDGLLAHVQRVGDLPVRASFAVIQQRMEFQELMRERFAAVIERATGRRVIGFMSGNQQDPDMMCEVFVLAPTDLVDDHEIPTSGLSFG